MSYISTIFPVFPIIKQSYYKTSSYVRIYFMQTLQFYKTRLKITIAKILYRILKLMLDKNKRQIKRGGIYYEIDLAEGIDISH